MVGRRFSRLKKIDFKNEKQKKTEIINLERNETQNE